MEQTWLAGLSLFNTEETHQVQVEIGHRFFVLCSPVVKLKDSFLKTVASLGAVTESARDTFSVV